MGQSSGSRDSPAAAEEWIVAILFIFTQTEIRVEVTGKPSDMRSVSRLWQDAAAILETASAQRESAPADFAIVVDGRSGIRMLDGAGWQLEALQTEYQAATAFLVTRTLTTVNIQATSGAERCALQRRLGATPLTGLTGGVAHHLIR